MNDDNEIALCTSCLEANPPNEHFCRKCGAPLSSYATTAPLERIHAMGWMYRRALSQPARLIVLLGIWLILGPTFLGAFFWVLWSGQHTFLNTISSVFWAGLSGLILYRITRNYLVERIGQGKDRAESD